MTAGRKRFRRNRPTLRRSERSILRPGVQIRTPEGGLHYRAGKMPPKNKIPWLDYEGQDTAQILACKGTHRIDSLLCALEQAIQLRQSRNPDAGTTPEEHTLLAIMALQREVNNGG